MNNIGKTLLIITLLGCITACSTLKPPIQSENLIDLTSKNLKLLNGTYKRTSISDTNRIKHYCSTNLFNNFFIYPSNLINDGNETDFVEMLVMDKNKIKITLISKDEIIKSKILKGKIVGNTFQFNRRIFTIPLVAMNYYEERLIRVSLLKNGNLNVDSSSEAIGSFIIFPWSGGGHEEYNLEFEKVK